MSAKGDVYRTGGQALIGAYTKGAASSFRSGVAGSAVWIVVGSDGHAHIYRSQGRTVVQAIQCRVGVRPDGYWGSRTNAALRRKLSERGVDPSFVADGRITARMLEAALALTYGTGMPTASGDADTIIVGGSVLPRWMEQPPADGDYTGETWHGPHPQPFELPRADVHPDYGRGPVCTATRPRRVWRADPQDIDPQAVGDGRSGEVGASALVPAAGIEDHGSDWMPAFGDVAGGPLTPGDAPSLLKTALVVGAAVLTGLAIAYVATDDSPPSARKETP